MFWPLAVRLQPDAADNKIERDDQVTTGSVRL
jgi:hypothetical protein